MSNLYEEDYSKAAKKRLFRNYQSSLKYSKESCVAMNVLRMRLLHAVGFSKRLRWLAQTKVITFKTQLHAVNAC